MSNPEARKKLIDKIVKLFRLGEHVATDGQRGTTEAEMMLAVTKARQLMLEHGVQMTEIESAKGDELAAKIEARIRYYGSYTRAGKLADYDWHVAWAVGTLTDTRVHMSRSAQPGKPGTRKALSWTPTTGVVFVGDEDDTAVADALFLIWLRDVRRLTRAAYGSTSWGTSHTSYAVGLATRLQHRAYDTMASQTQALVVRAKADAIDKFVKREASAQNVNPLSKKAKRDSAAYARGYRDGADFNMATKVVPGGK